MGKLTGRIAVVVGGHGGIGGAIAERFAAEGATVYATSRRAGAAAHGEGTVRPVRADASDRGMLARALDGIRSGEGRIDILAVSAGISEFAEIGDVSEDHYDRTFGVNVCAAVFAVQSAVAAMPEGGSVVLVGSIADTIGTKGYGAYNASKAAVRSFARTWANELAPRGIRVNVVAPGPTDTAMFASASDEVRATLTGLIPLGCMGRAEEVAAAALFLASDEESFVTGAELPVDGGMAQV